MVSEVDVEMSIENRLRFEKAGDPGRLVDEHLKLKWGSAQQMYTNGSEDPESGRARFGMSTSWFEFNQGRQGCCSLLIYNKSQTAGKIIYFLHVTSPFPMI